MQNDYRSLSAAADEPDGLLTALIVRTCCYLLLCAAYIQGGLIKATDFGGALGEMAHFGLTPPGLFAPAVIALELGASFAIVMGIARSVAACLLAVFTLAATFMANRYWELSGEARFFAANSFFEHLGLVGAFLFVAWEDRQRRRNEPRLAGRSSR